MAKYIDKSALVAEIERRKNQFMSQADNFHSLGMEEKKDHFAVLASNMHSILSFLDTLEVKEVDLEKEIKEEYLKRRCYGGRDNMLVILNEPQFNTIAKHFYELGLKAQKGE